MQAVGSGVIVRSLEDVKRRGGYAENAGVWTSARYLLRDDAVGFSMTHTTFAAGQTLEMQYKNHLEANLIIEGEAEVTDLESGQTHRLVPGSMYALDKHDRHRLRALTDLRIVCVFSPALQGAETHDDDGSYPLL